MSLDTPDTPETPGPEIVMPEQRPTPLAPTDTPPNSVLFGADGLRAGWSLLIFLVLLSIVYTLAIPVFRYQLAHHATAAHAGAQRSTEQPISVTLTQDGILFAGLLLCSAIMSRIEGRPFARYGIGATPRALRLLITGIVWALLFLSLLVLLLRAMHLLAFDGRLLQGPAAFGYAAEWALGFLLVALFEEYFLRGFLLFTLARGLSAIYALALRTPHRDALGFWTAATLLAFAFGLSHGLNPGESPLGLLTAGLAALVFSLSLWRTGSLWWAIGFHAAWDWAQSFLYGVPDSGILMEHHLLASHPVGTPILSGGLTGPEGSVFVLPVLLGIAVVIWTTLPQAHRPYLPRPLSPETSLPHPELT